MAHPFPSQPAPAHTVRYAIYMLSPSGDVSNWNAGARAALFQSQKMEAIGQLTGGVAHDFNNLLYERGCDSDAREKVLVVEDEEDLAVLAATLFESLGYDVLVAPYRLPEILKRLR